MGFSGRFTKKFFGFSLTPGRLLAWGIPLLLILCLGFWWLWPAWQNFTLKRALLNQKSALLTRYEKKLTLDKPKLERELARGQALGKKVFVGLDPYVIVSDLEKGIDQIPELSLRSFRITKREDLTPQVQKVKLVLVLEGDIKGLLTFLQRLEHQDKALHVVRLVVTPRRYRHGYILNATLEVEAFYAEKAL